MRIGFCGVKQADQNEFIAEFRKLWPSYTIDVGKITTELPNENIELSKIEYDILNNRIDRAMEYNKNKNVIHLNTTLESLTEIFWNASKDIKGFDDLMIQKAIMLARQSMTFYDVLFYTPIMANETTPVDEKSVELDNFYSAILETYTTGKRWIFPFDDAGGSCPMIEIFGTIPEKIEMIKLYINPDGASYSEKDSLISDAIQ